MFEPKQVHLNSRVKPTHTHTPGDEACSSWVFCGLDSHRCFLWLHYCYLNVGGRSAASINGILSTADAAQDTHTQKHARIDICTCTCRHTLPRKACGCTLRAIWITNTSAICNTTEYFQPFRHISQQSFDLSSPCTTWCISNALLCYDTLRLRVQFEEKFVFLRLNFTLLLIWPCPLEFDVVGGAWVVCRGDVLFCQGQSELSWNTCSDGIVLNWWRPPPSTLPTLPDQMRLDRHPWPLTLDLYLICFSLENHSWNSCKPFLSSL